MDKRGLFAEQWRRDNELRLKPGGVFGGTAIPDLAGRSPDNYWRMVFDTCMPDASGYADTRKQVEGRLEMLASATRQTVAHTGRGRPPLIRMTFYVLAELPVHDARLLPEDWALLAFGLALRALLEEAAQADLDDESGEGSFRLGAAANRAFRCLEGEITHRLVDTRIADPVAARADAARRMREWIRSPSLYNDSGWNVLELSMRSLVELIVSRSGLFHQKPYGRHRGISDLELQASDDCRMLIGKAASPGLQQNHPMLVPPGDWQKGRRGGHLQGAKRLNKLRRQNALSADVLGLVEDADIPRVFSALNVLQRTPWRVNHVVLSICQRIYHTEPEGSLLPEIRKLRAAYNLRKEPALEWTEARRVDANNRTWSARLGDLASQEAFHFPYQLDYRGRIYPQAGWLSPQGDDLAKGLLEFATGKPVVTDEARQFLAVHGSQFVSTENIARALNIENRMPTRQERLDWVMLNEPQILLSAADPLANPWWIRTAKRKDRWQMLAFCLAWATAKRGEPCHLPVCVDGSCNGLQHMAALLRDRTLAKHTNLLKGASQEDTYTWVQKTVQKAIGDVAGDSDSPFQLLAKWVAEHQLLNRDAAKKVVMKFSYGSDRYKDDLREFLDEKLDERWQGQSGDWPALLLALDQARAAGPFSHAVRVPGWDTKMDEIPDGDAADIPAADSDTPLHGDDAGEQVDPSGKASEAIRAKSRHMPDAGQLEHWLQSIHEPAWSLACIDGNEIHLLKNFLHDRLASFLALHFNSAMKVCLPSAIELRRTLMKWCNGVVKSSALPLIWVSPVGYPVIQIRKMGVAEKHDDSDEVQPVAERESSTMLSKGSKQIPGGDRLRVSADWTGLGELEKFLPPDCPSFLGFNTQGHKGAREPGGKIRTDPGRRQVYKEIYPNTLVSGTGQASSFPPNLIHSLDSAHLILTINRCKQLQLDAFVAVHDSFGTHAADAGKLGRALRDSFMLLHRAPLLKDLREWFELLRDPERHAPPGLTPMQGSMLALWRNTWLPFARGTDARHRAITPLPEHPQPDLTFDIDEVSESEYIFF